MPPFERTAPHIEQALADEVEGPLPGHIHAHLPRAAQAAEKNLERLQARHGADLVAAQRQLFDVMAPHTPKANRLARVRFIAGQWSKAVSTQAACRGGCSHCCHINTAVPRQEAELISKAIRRPVARDVKTYLAHEMPHRDDFFGVPCTFLKEGKCSIYEHRPLTCRTLLNLDDDDTLCKLVKGAAIPVPYANATAIQVAFVQAMPEQEWADIRQWFPAEPTAGQE